MRKCILAGALGAALLLPVAASAGGFAVHPRAHHPAAIRVHAPIVLVNGHPQRLAFGHRRYHRDDLGPAWHGHRVHCAHPRVAHRAGLRYRHHFRHHRHDRHYRHHVRYRAFPQPGLFLSFVYRD